MKKIKVIGLGGIGTAFLPFLCRYLNFADGERCRMTLVDGDDFQAHNAKRQSFGETGKKARVKAEELGEEFENIAFRPITEFVTRKNVSEIIEEGDIVLLGVDNHPTRVLVSDHCEKLDDIILISAGNDLTDGNVQVHIRRGGEEIEPPLTKFHPELYKSKEKHPADIGCEELARLPASNQILVTNLMAAAWMFVAFYLIDKGEERKVGEFYFDILAGAAQRVTRR